MKKYKSIFNSVQVGKKSLFLFLCDAYGLILMIFQNLKKNRSIIMTLQIFFCFCFYFCLVGTWFLFQSCFIGFFFLIILNRNNWVPIIHLKERYLVSGFGHQLIWPNEQLQNHPFFLSQRTEI